MNAGKISVITVLLSLLSFFILSDCALAKYSGGSGTAGDPYKIGTPADLLALGTNTGDYDANFILTADINLADSGPFTTAIIAPDTDNSASGFQGVRFSGVFDGNGHTISNLTIDSNGAGNDYLGLFGRAYSGEIKNLGLEDVNIAGDDNSIYLGGLVGYNWLGIISNCYSTGKTSGGDNSGYLGGLVGQNENGNISNCYSTGAVTGGDNSGYLGGLAGYNNGIISNCYSTGAVTGGDNSGCLGGLAGYNNGIISNCYSTGAVTGGTYLGGLVGWNSGGSISNCYSTGAVTGGTHSNYIGGLVGWNSGGSISNCYSTGSVNSGISSQSLGGLVGYNGAGISNCYSAGTVSGGAGSSNLGGLVGTNSGGTISNCYFLAGSGPNNGNGTSLTDPNMKKQSSFSGWDFVGETINGPNDIWAIIEGVDYPKLSALGTYSGGTGTADDPFQIATVADLLTLATNTKNYDKSFILTADINLAEAGPFTTAIIAPDTDNSVAGFQGVFFTGVFDGNGHTISNMTIDTGGAKNDYLGLFGLVIGGEIKNLGLEDVSITGGNNSSALGGLAGNKVDGDVSSCYSTGAVSGGAGSSYLGGLVGWNNGSSTSNCYSTCTVTGASISTYLGGLLGQNVSCNISNCYSTGAVTGGDSSEDLGGLIGYNDNGNISNCYSSGDVSGMYDVGGLVGGNSSGIISNCYSIGAVTGGDNSQRLGGLVGGNSSGIISNCYSIGAVTGGDNSYYLGGLVGYNNSDISNCYSSGAVISGDDSDALGGLVGDNAGIISNCYSIGNITGGAGSTQLGGLAGRNVGGGVIGNCFSSGKTSSGTDSQKVGGLVGFNDDSYIYNCYSTGNVNSGGGASQNIGGLVGDNGSGAGNIENCYSTGDANGGGGSSANIGGLVGNNNGSIYSCYSTGTAGGGTSYVNELVGYHIAGGGGPDIISNCYFLGSSGPNDVNGTPLTDKQMKQQKSFEGWDFEDIWWINEKISYPKLYWQFDVTKCTVTAGSKANKDKISFSGAMDAVTVDFNDANNTIRVTVYSNDIVNIFDQNFPIDANTFKKGKYNYSKTVGGVKKSFTYDVKTRKFAFAASDVNLLGLDCPVTAKIDIGDYDGIAELDEAIVNGSRVPIPIKLMNGVKNVLRVDKCTVKQNNKPNKDQLTAGGAFAVKNPDPCMANWITEGLVITLGSQQFDIHKNSLKAGKGMFSCSNVKVTDPNATAAATFNFNLCSFTLTIKNANIPPVSGDVDFGTAFADFDEVDQVTFP